MEIDLNQYENTEIYKRYHKQWCQENQYENDCGWGNIRNAPDITWEIVEANPDKKWDWSELSINPNITWEIVEANPDKEWDWSELSINPNITWEIVEANPDITLETIKIDYHNSIWNNFRIAAPYNTWEEVCENLREKWIRKEIEKELLLIRNYQKLVREQLYPELCEVVMHPDNYDYFKELKL